MVSMLMSGKYMSQGWSTVVPLNELVKLLRLRDINKETFLDTSKLGVEVVTEVV